MRRVSAIALLSLAYTAALAAPAPTQSWGKVGISLAQYRQDALECGLKGYYTDVSQTEAAKTLGTASRRLDNLSVGGVAATAGENAIDEEVLFANQSQRIVAAARPEKQFTDVKTILQSSVDECLASRGYSRFLLSQQQREDLRKLKAGSDERRAYLYRLASNPDVLRSQAIQTQP